MTKPPEQADQVPQPPPVRNWPEAFYRLASDSLYSGKFFKFAGLALLLAMIWRIQSADWVVIIGEAIRSSFIGQLGWILLVVCALGMTLWIRWTINRMQQEIDRLVDERNHWQKVALDDNIRSSQYGKKKGKS